MKLRITVPLQTKNNMATPKAALLILDGWGHGNMDQFDAVHHAKTQYFDSLYNNNIHCKLRTDGLFVGLPEGQMGNSEVGHLNIGAGRVVFQDLVRINNSIKENTLKENSTIKEIVNLLQNDSTKRLHLTGLVSDGGIHSHVNHLFALIDIFRRVSNQVFIHAFTDGRDTDPKSGLVHLKTLENYISNSSNINIASIIGRYYAMDRDQRWERVAEAYNLMVNSQGEEFQSSVAAIKHSYNNNITDEFVKASKIHTQEDSSIHKGDIVFCFNYRTDRCREISMVLSQTENKEHGLHPLDITYVTMTKYDANFNNVRIVFDKDNLKNSLGEVLEKNNRTQLRIAETEKYPHVTFFFSGGREHKFKGETRILAPSPKVATYDLQPEMSANQIKEETIKHVQSEYASDFICLNFANPDMVGHTGVFSAVTKAIETVDSCLSELVPALIKENYQIIIIADHGNAEKMANNDGSCHTAHTTNPVPCILLNTNFTSINDGKLADIAPTILDLMNISQPTEMNGVSLI